MCPVLWLLTQYLQSLSFCQVNCTYRNKYHKSTPPTLSAPKQPLAGTVSKLTHGKQSVCWQPALALTSKHLCLCHRLTGLLAWLQSLAVLFHQPSVSYTRLSSFSQFHCIFLQIATLLHPPFLVITACFWRRAACSLLYCPQRVRDGLRNEKRNKMLEQISENIGKRNSSIGGLRFVCANPSADVSRPL